MSISHDIEILSHHCEEAKRRSNLLKNWRRTPDAFSRRIKTWILSRIISSRDSRTEILSLPDLSPHFRSFIADTKSSLTSTKKKPSRSPCVPNCLRFLHYWSPTSIVLSLPPLYPPFLSLLLPSVPSSPNCSVLLRLLPLKSLSLLSLVIPSAVNLMSLNLIKFLPGRSLAYWSRTSIGLQMRRSNNQKAALLRLSGVDPAGFAPASLLVRGSVLLHELRARIHKYILQKTKKGPQSGPFLLTSSFSP